MSAQPILGVMGGSGLYDMSALKNVRTQSVQTPFGAPSDDVILGELNGITTAFIPRHGKGHRFTPSEVPYRANVWALKSLGVQFVLSVSAVGSMKEEIVPGDLVVCDQFIDRTTGRDRSFFGEGVVGHMEFAEPICPLFRPMVLSAAQKTEASVHDGGTYICIEGPTFSTRAESLLFRTWGVSVIGMTNLPEARLVREAGMSYSTLALATDYDCWRENEDAVSVEAVIAVLMKNVATAQKVVANVAQALAEKDAPKVSPYADIAKTAIMTQAGVMPVNTKMSLSTLFGEYLG